jgi:hypothetical protein
MDDRDTKRTITGFTLALLLALPLGPTTPRSEAALREPSAAEPQPSARRTAARAIERRASTQWLSDVAERLRILEEHAGRAATPAETSSGATSPTPLRRRSPR